MGRVRMPLMCTSLLKEVLLNSLSCFFSFFVVKDLECLSREIKTINNYNITLLNILFVDVNSREFIYNLKCLVAPKSNLIHKPSPASAPGYFDT